VTDHLQRESPPQTPPLGAIAPCRESTTNGKSQQQVTQRQPQTARSASPFRVLMGLIRNVLWAPDGEPPAGWSAAREVSVLKRLLAHRTVSQIESAILGLAQLRHTGEIAWLKPGQKITTRALYNTRSGAWQMFELATAAYWRHDTAL